MYCYVKEHDLIREVLFALQGLNGRIIRQDTDGRFTITKSHFGLIDPTQRMLLEKLTSFGWLVNKIKNHINFISKNPNQGKVSHCLAAALNNELYEYYHMVTQIEQQLQKSNNQLDNGRTRASTPTSELYACVGSNPGINSNGINLNSLGPKQSATYESLHTAISAYNGGSNHHNPHHDLNHPNYHHLNNNLVMHHHQQANSDDGFGSQMCSAPSSNASPTIPAVTLHQIHVWTLKHYFRLKTLAMLVECCKGERGGHLAKIVYRFMQQGDKQIRAIITRILSQVVIPIRQMLSQWIFRGEIQDPFDEFFICLEDQIGTGTGLTSSVTMMSIATSTPKNSYNNNNNNNNHHHHHQHVKPYQSQTNDSVHLPSHMQQHRGHNLTLSSSMNSLSCASSEENQYVINDRMMPGFISKQQANKILATGKAIHLLRKVCADSVASSVPGYDDLKKSFESTNIESLFRSKGLINCGEKNEFEHLLNTAYKEVSQKALELLLGNYKLQSHFRGLRNYLLLGQGDFIRHLIDLLETELDKQATECRFHNILSVLECAMRSTNAQFDEPDVTNRLDCRLLDPPTARASGWDIFSLVYKVDGPISTIFTEEKIRDYVDIFRQLWRTKRIEHVMLSLWSNRTFYSKQATDLPLLSHIFHRANLLLTVMMRFMQDYQNFILFEVVESSWKTLVGAITSAKDVDDIITAHDSYLKTIKTATLCQKDTNMLFDTIIEFQQLMNKLWKEFDSTQLKNCAALVRQEKLNAYQSQIQKLTDKFEANRGIKFEK